MNTYAQKGQIIEMLRDEELKPAAEQSSWKNRVYFYPQSAIFILNDFPLSSECVFELVCSRIIIYDGLHQHQGDLMPCYKFNIEHPLNYLYNHGTRYRIY